MRKILGVLLSVLCVCCAAIGLTGCKKDKHIHVFDKQVITDEYKATDATCSEKATYYYSCECGEKGAGTFACGDPLGHSFTNYVSDNNATCTQDGTKSAKCDRCNKKNTVKDIDSKLNHSYTKQIVSDEYLAAPATCTEKATYYYSCECGAIGIETFEYGSITSHNFVNGRCTYCGKGQEASKGLEFTLLDDGMYEVSGIGSCTDAEIVIPRKHNDKAVTNIGYRAFEGCSELTSITIPDSVNVIGSNAFEGCNAIASIKIGSIESWCNIAGLENLMRYGTDDKKLYLNGKEITELIIPDSVTNIEAFAFYNCSGLISITIPDSVISIGSNAFEGNDIASININSIESWCKIDGLSSLMRYRTDDKKLYLNGEKITELIIPDGVTNIEEFAFFSCSGLTSVTISDSVTSIGSCAFSCCLGLKNLIIPDSVISIGGQAFYHCENVETIEVSKNNTVYSAVNNCLIEKETKTLIFGCRNSIIPDDGSVTTIGVFAFDGCRGLTSIVIPNRVNKISRHAFNLCYDLLSVTIGSNVKTIETGAFENCFKLIEIINKCDIEITKGSTENGQVGYNAVVIKKDGESEIENVDGFLFYNYENINYLLGYTGNDAELILPDTYKGQSYEMNHDVFLYRYDLNSISIGNNVTDMSDYMFFGCGNLRSVIIGSNIKSIGERAFAYCESLTSIIYNGNIADWKNITKGINWNYEVPTDCVIHCTDGDIKISD